MTKHTQNDLRPDLSKEPWSGKEEFILCRVHCDVGNQWAEVARYLPGRSENTIKNKWWVWRGLLHCLSMFLYPHMACGALIYPLPFFVFKMLGYPRERVRWSELIGCFRYLGRSKCLLLFYEHVGDPSVLSMKGSIGNEHVLSLQLM